ncbi:MAG TPA: lytic transglycosylase domain-containing protein [Pyrinomonadaceae bacterium]|nr:lytic transglycosylase domain-containing protein [Pyrinomonadaceae bacterium]
MKNFIPRSLLAALFVASSFAAAGAQAKPKTAKASAAPKAEQAAPAEDLQKFRQDFIKAAEDYKASLVELSNSYEASLKKATEKQEQLKSLYTDGLISRKEYEESGSDIADARAKVEQMRAEIAKADETIAAARKPVDMFAAPMSVAPTDVAWTTGNKTVDNLIRYNGKRFGVDPYLIYCVMHQESRFSSGATSPVGAQGLMQLMPGTAARYGVVNSYDPAQSIMGGTRYLADLLRLFGGRVDLALAGYNAGEGAVMKYGNRVPPYAETRNYVRTIGARYAQSGGNGFTLTTKTEAREAKGQKK